MGAVHYTLLSDGSSDRALMSLLNWMLREKINGDVSGEWADFGRLSRPPRGLSERIAKAVELYPCNLLFVHRDAERMVLAVRVEEIHQAIAQISLQDTVPPIVCVVPVRMMEAWLLFDEDAIRRAAGNPYGRVALDLPRLRDIENLPEPKECLYQLLRDAKGNFARRRQTHEARNVHRVADFIEDFSPLRELPAFRALEAEVVAALERLSID